MLILFDIDGTLVVTAGAGVRGMNRAFEQLYGSARVLETVPIAGRTDRAIVVDVMRALGVEPTEEAIGRLRDLYLDCLRTEIALPMEGHPSRVLPGVMDLLDALAGERHVMSALLTGNFERGAAIKLTHFSLWDRFRCGAFGDDHVDRRALMPVALERARAAWALAEAPDQVVIIGDTPSDIDCAIAHGARAIGVATGPYDRPALEAAGADLVLDTLADVDRVMDWLLATSKA